MNKPLYEIIRPENLDEFIGQQHLIGESKPIRTMISKNKITSMIFRGPPGVGKTTLAKIISNSIDADFFKLSGVSSKKEDLMEIIERAQKNRQYGKNTVIFLDEIHRWNKAQQDSLLPFLEDGTIALIGATTENPSFTIINALISRCRVFVFNKIQPVEIYEFIKNNLDKINSEFPKIKIDDEIIKLISEIGNGDLRNSLNILETSLLISNGGKVSKEDVTNSLTSQLYYDRDGEEHYNIISAVHKSLRDSDPHASCYWIGRMLKSGEDPLYIVRRLIRFASEDIGLANNNALLLANTVYESVQKVGMPECEIFLYQLAIYLAESPKDNKVYKLSHMVHEDIEKFGNLPVPMQIRNAPTQFMKDLGYGAGYKYAHDQKDKKADNQHFPDELKGRKYF